MDAELIFWIVVLAMIVLAYCGLRILNLNALAELANVNEVEDVDFWMHYYHKNKRYNRV